MDKVKKVTREWVNKAENENRQEDDRNDVLELHLFFTFIVVSTVPNRKHPWLRAILKGQSKVLGGIGHKNSISTLWVFGFDIFGLMDIKGRMSRVIGQEPDGLVNGFLFFWTKAGVTFQKDALKEKFKGRDSGRHNQLFLDTPEGFNRCKGRNTGKFILINLPFTFHPFR